MSGFLKVAQLFSSNSLSSLHFVPMLLPPLNAALSSTVVFLHFDFIKHSGLFFQPYFSLNDDCSSPSLQLLTMRWAVLNPNLFVSAVSPDISLLAAANVLTFLKQTNIFSKTTGCVVQHGCLLKLLNMWNKIVNQFNLLARAAIRASEKMFQWPNV